MRENWQNSKITFRIILFILFQCAKSKPFPCKSYFWTAHKPFHIGWNLQKFSKPEFFPNLSKLFKRLKNLVHNTYQVIHLRSSATRRDEKKLDICSVFCDRCFKQMCQLCFVKNSTFDLPFEFRNASQKVFTAHLLVRKNKALFFYVFT